MGKIIAGFILAVQVAGCAAPYPYFLAYPVRHVVPETSVYLEERRIFYDHSEPSNERRLEDGTLSEIQRVDAKKIRLLSCDGVCHR